MHAPAHARRRHPQKCACRLLQRRRKKPLNRMKRLPELGVVCSVAYQHEKRPSRCLWSEAGLQLLSPLVSGVVAAVKRLRWWKSWIPFMEEQILGPRP